MRILKGLPWRVQIKLAMVVATSLCSHMAYAQSWVTAFANQGFCGDGRLMGEEVCDPGLSATCSASCTERGSVLGCETNSDCPPGQSCGSRNGGSFGSGNSSDICWPSPCESALTRAANCGTQGTACGTCPAADSCAPEYCKSNASSCLAGQVDYCEDRCGSAASCALSTQDSCTICPDRCGCHLKCTAYELGFPPKSGRWKLSC